MLFPPPGVKIRRTIETLFLPGTATLIAEHDPTRVLLLVLLDWDASVIVAFAGSVAGLSTKVSLSVSMVGQYSFIGPEEVWARCVFPDTPPGGNILIQSVFYD